MSAEAPVATPHRRSPRPRVGVLVEARYLDQPEPAGVVAALARAGVEARLFVDTDDGFRLGTDFWAPQVDVLLARGRSSALLGLLRAAEELGVVVVNSARSIEAVVNKAGMSGILGAAGIPTPHTWLGSPAALADLPGLPYPLVLKPICGDNARGLRVVRSAAELAGTEWPEPVALAQEFHRGEGLDLKLYAAGRRVWAVSRPSPVEASGLPRPSDGPGRSVPVTPALEALAHRCGDAFGMRVFGVDCVRTPYGVLVLEVNDFPNFRAAEGADEEIAALVLELAATGVPA